MSTPHVIERIDSVREIHEVETVHGTPTQASDRAVVLCEETGARHRVRNPFGRYIYTAVPEGGAR